MVVGAFFNAGQLLEDARVLEWDQLDVTDPLESLYKIIVCQEVRTDERLDGVCERFSCARIQSAVLPLQRHCPVFHLGVSHDSHEPMHTQVVISDSEYVKVGHKDYFRILDITLSSFGVVPFESVGEKCGGQLQNGVSIRLKHLVAPASGVDAAACASPHNELWGGLPNFILRVHFLVCVS